MLAIGYARDTGVVVRNRAMLALATALVFSSCNQTTTSPSPSAADLPPTTLTITITVEEVFGAFDIEKCGRRHVGRVALAEYAGVPNNSQLAEWITDNRDEYETWCIAHYYELFEPTESSDHSTISIRM